MSFLLDLLTAFIVLGMIIANLTDQTTENGFQINGWPALLFFICLIAYFVIGNHLGGTIWRRIFGVRPIPKA
nr:hypothetical protein [Microvirga solisilvae]